MENEKIIVKIPKKLYRKTDKDMLDKLDSIKDGLNDLNKKEFPEYPRTEIPPYPEFPEIEYPSEIKISNLGDIKQPIIKTETIEFPDGLKNFETNSFLDRIRTFIKEATQTVRNVIIGNKKADEYIPVRIVYKEGDRLFFDPAFGGASTPADGGGGGGGVVTQGTTPWVIGDGAGSITVDGTFWQATQPVSGTFWQATQPVSATDLNIR